MDQLYLLIEPLIEPLIRFLLLSSLLAIFTYALIKILPQLRTSVFFWKLLLVISFMPLIPLEWVQPYFNQLIAIEVPSLTSMPMGIQTVEADHPLIQQFNQAEPAVSMSFQITSVLLVAGLALVSIFKLSKLFFTHYRFSKAIKDELTECNKLNLKSFQDKTKTDVFILNKAIPPCATGIFKPKVILPKSFLYLDPKQQSLLVEHEITHIHQKDIIWITTTQFLSSLFWFLPSIQLVRLNLNQAIELRCDQIVLNNNPNDQITYGQTLIQTLRESLQPQSTAVAYFGGTQFNKLKERVQHIKDSQLRRGLNKMEKFTLYSLVIAFLTATFAVTAEDIKSLTVEDFISMHENSRQNIERETPNIELTGNWLNPLPNSRISSKYKVKQKIRNHRAHLGIDMVAPKGTDIQAASSGRVFLADDQSLHKNYGKVVLIDHGDGVVTLYAHMNEFKVKKGDQVNAGDIIGTVGKSGKVTGAHLHFELLTNGQHLDPEEMISLK